MSKPLAFGTAGALVAAAALALGFVAGNRPQAAAAQATEAPALEHAMSRAEIEEIVHSYLIANPGIVREMQAALDEQDRELERLAQIEAIEESAADLFNATYDGVIGNPEGDVTVVEFFDYNCGFCKRALEDMNALVAADPQLRFVLKEFPILGPDSQKAHVVSMAFHTLAPEKYGEFHRALLTGGRATEDAAIAAAIAQGVDEAALRETMKSPAIEQAFATTYQLANQLTITGTPSYVVGTEVVFGALGQAVLREKIEQARATN